jgi:hypothetical protein
VVANLERNGYASNAVAKGLHSGHVAWRFRYDLLNRDRQFKLVLGNVLADGAAVEFNSLQPIMGTGKFVLAEDGTQIDWGNDLIRPWAMLRMPDGGFAEFALGTLVLAVAPLNVSDSGLRTRAVQAYDLSRRLDTPCGARYTVYAGDNVVAKVRSIVEGQGLTAHNLTSSGRSMPATREWEPSDTWLQIVNDLLGMIAYNPLWFDVMGVAQATPYVTPDKRSPNYVYRADSLSVIHRPAERGQDWDRTPNHWVRYTSGTDIDSLWSEVTNSNPNSPTSTVNRGYTITDVESADATDQESLDELVRRAAWEASQVYEVTQFTTGLMPFHGFQDVLLVDYPDLGPAANYVEVYWGLELKKDGAMKHVVRRIVPV